MASNVGTNQPYERTFDDPQRAVKAGKKGGAAMKAKAAAKRAKAEVDAKLASGEEVPDELFAKLSLADLSKIAIDTKNKMGDRIKAHEAILRNTKAPPPQRIEQSGTQTFQFVIGGKLAQAHEQAAIDVDARPALPA